MLEHDQVMPVSIVLWAVGGLLAVIGTLASLIYKKNNERFDEQGRRMDSLEADIKKTVQKDTYEKNRDETRQWLVSLDEKIERNDQRAQDRHDNVMAALLELKKK